MGLVCNMVNGITSISIKGFCQEIATSYLKLESVIRSRRGRLPGAPSSCSNVLIHIFDKQGHIIRKSDTQQCF